MLLRLSRYWINNLVIRWQLILTVIVLWAGSAWLKANYAEDDSNLWLVMQQFLIIIQWTLIALFSVSLLTALLTWAFFLYRKNQKQVSVQVQFGDGQRAEAGFVKLIITITGAVIRPLLGTIRAKLIFTDKKYSDIVILDTDVFRKRGLIRQAIRGEGQTMLHDRGIYDVEKVHLLFCDMFSLVALPCSLPFTQQLYTLPKEYDTAKVSAQPNSTEEQKHRIEIPRKVEGEYNNYKEFETGDNIRRIVWKIYAKSGQLVVRIPETKDPYASHLYFYASFYNGMNAGDGIFESELLNVYKDKVRNLFEALQKNGYDVRIPHDQEVAKLSGMGDKHVELFQITASSWQQSNPPLAYVNPGKAAFVCLSSLVQVAEIEAVIRNLPMNVPLVVVKVSEAIKSPFRFTIKDIFIKPEKDPVDKLRNPWLISPLRQKIQRNETDIEKVLKVRGNAWMVSSIISK